MFCLESCCEMMQLMTAELMLDLPWVDASKTTFEGLDVRRGRISKLQFDDGIVLDVQVVDPGSYRDAPALIAGAKGLVGPGRVVLVAGSVPLAWRAELREAGVSFVDVSGIAEIAWPRVDVSAGRFGQQVRRHRAAVPLQKGHGLVAQELLVQAMDESRPSIGELAASTGVSLPSASKAVSQLEAHGLVVKHREGARVSVELVDSVALARRLAEGTGWPGPETLRGYLWGRTVFDVAARLSAAADRSEVELAVTGRVGAAYVGVLGTASPKHLRAWVAVGDRSLVDVAAALGLEPAPDEAANVVLSNDKWRVGVTRRHYERFDDFNAWAAHPVRIWCDLHDEQRGAEYAAQMWSVVTHGD